MKLPEITKHAVIEGKNPQIPEKKNIDPETVSVEIQEVLRQEAIFTSDLIEQGEKIHIEGLTNFLIEKGIDSIKAQKISTYIKFELGSLNNLHLDFELGVDVISSEGTDTEIRFSLENDPSEACNHSMLMADINDSFNPITEVFYCDFAKRFLLKKKVLKNSRKKYARPVEEVRDILKR